MGIIGKGCGVTSKQWADQEKLRIGTGRLDILLVGNMGKGCSAICKLSDTFARGCLIINPSTVLPNITNFRSISEISTDCKRRNRMTT